MPALERPGASAPLRIVVYGTSLSAEWSPRFWRRCGGHWVRALRARLGADFGPRATLHNVSRWGADSAWGKTQLQRRVLRRPPDLVIMEFAINDADTRRNISLQASRGNFVAMLERIAACAPHSSVLPLIGGPVKGRHAAVRPRLTDYWRAWREIALERRLTPIDLTPVWPEQPDSAAGEAFLPDGLHPGKRAAALILPVVGSALRTAVGNAPHLYP